jgi:hypothetical protein
MSRIILWSCGGGRQSAGIAALLVLGKLPLPDHACMTRIEWEFERVWPYVDTFIRPALAKLGVPFTAIPRARYATKNFWGGASGKSILLPVHTNQSGKHSKLKEYCSGEWKRETVLRWSAEQFGWKKRGVSNWVGISLNEAHRRRGPRRQWFQPAYPLLDILPTDVDGCLAAVREVGWPEPPRSRCLMCPNQSDSEWAELTPREWEIACKIDEEIRGVDPHAFLHRQLLPLRQVTLNPKDDNGGQQGGCSAGTCF